MDPTFALISFENTVEHRDTTSETLLQRDLAVLEFMPSFLNVARKDLERQPRASTVNTVWRKIILPL